MMTEQIQAAIGAFRKIILGGVPLLLQQDETAFLSFMCSLAAIDALAAYRYTTGVAGIRFRDFITEYFPTAYAPHVRNLYRLRCRILLNFSLAYFTLTHARPGVHLQTSPIGDTILSDDVFFQHLANAATNFFNEVEVNVDRQNAMHARLLNIDEGGAIFY
jgi:hypothetical protein